MPFTCSDEVAAAAIYGVSMASNHDRGEGFIVPKTAQEVASEVASILAK